MVGKNILEEISEAEHEGTHAVGIPESYQSKMLLENKDQGMGLGKEGFNKSRLRNGHHPTDDEGPRAGWKPSRVWAREAI